MDISNVYVIFDTQSFLMHIILSYFILWDSKHSNKYERYLTLWKVFTQRFMECYIILYKDMMNTLQKWVWRKATFAVRCAPDALFTYNIKKSLWGGRDWGCNIIVRLMMHIFNIYIKARGNIVLSLEITQQQ